MAVWPWITDRYALVSLADMIDRYAAAYARLLRDLTDANSQLWIKRMFAHAEEKKSDVFAASDKEIEQTLAALRKASDYCKVLPMGTLVSDIERAIQQNEDVAIGDRLQMSLLNIIQKVLDELALHKFLYVPPADAALYENPAPFGDVIARKFPRLSSDISEAAKCLALGRPTACVFHLMRVMEYTVQRFGRRLRIAAMKTKPVTEMEWGAILIEVNKVVAAMPRGKRKERFGAVAAHLGTVAIGWRNPTMHPKATYTPEEATAIYRSVEDFMRHFVRL